MPDTLDMRSYSRDFKPRRALEGRRSLPLMADTQSTDSVVKHIANNNSNGNGKKSSKMVPSTPQDDTCTDRVQSQGQRMSRRRVKVSRTVRAAGLLYVVSRSMRHFGLGEKLDVVIDAFLLFQLFSLVPILIAPLFIISSTVIPYPVQVRLCARSACTHRLSRRLAFAQ